MSVPLPYAQNSMLMFKKLIRPAKRVQELDAVIHEEFRLLDKRKEDGELAGAVMLYLQSKTKSKLWEANIFDYIIEKQNNFQIDQNDLFQGGWINEF